VSHDRHDRLLRPWTKRIALTSAGAAVLLTVGLGGSPGQADPGSGAQSGDKPTISEVEATIERLHHEAEVVSEELNAARVRATNARDELKVLRADVRFKRDAVESLRTLLIGRALDDYQNAAGLTTTTSFLLSDDPDTFFADVANASVDSRQQAQVLTRFSDQVSALAAQVGRARSTVVQVEARTAEIADHKSALAGKIAEAERLLDELEEKQRARLLALQEEREREAELRSEAQLSRTATRPTSTGAASGSAAIAVRTALAQVGDPYVYGAAGPDSFDCSGLTMYAWAAAGVSISHASSMQPSEGTPVSISELMPGDLVFYYSPISHVGMYIGNGQIVHASNPSSPVEVVPLNLMPIAMAVRVG
jgi:cell wall-associated NlpC family hydrolase